MFQHLFYLFFSFLLINNKEKKQLYNVKQIIIFYLFAIYLFITYIMHLLCFGFPLLLVEKVRGCNFAHFYIHRKGQLNYKLEYESYGEPHCEQRSKEMILV